MKRIKMSVSLNDKETIIYEGDILERKLDKQNKRVLDVKVQLDAKYILRYNLENGRIWASEAKILVKEF